MRRLILVFLLAAGALLRGVESPLGSPDDVAKLFGYPSGKLQVEDVTGQFREKRGPSVLCAYEYTAKDRTFAPITVILGAAGTILDREFRAQIEEYAKTIAQPENKSGEGLFLRKLDFTEGVSGYAISLGFGPGGASWGALLTFPRQNLDLHISTFISRNTPLMSSADTQKYHDEVFENEHFWIDHLSAAAKAGADRILSKPFREKLEKPSSSSNPATGL